jgi:hypothetical protein
MAMLEDAFECYRAWVALWVMSSNAIGCVRIIIISGWVIIISGNGQVYLKLRVIRVDRFWGLRQGVPCDQQHRQEGIRD